MPSVVTKTEYGLQRYDLGSLLLNERIVMLNGQVDENMAEIIIEELLYLDSVNHDDIFLYINSPGGEIASGLAIYDTMNLIASDVVTVGMGKAASMGAFLLAAGAKGKRSALPNCMILIHQPLGGVQGQASEIEIVANQILKSKQKLNSILAENTGKELEEIAQKTDRDYYMTAQEAVDFGLIDRIMKNKENH